MKTNKKETKKVRVKMLIDNQFGYSKKVVSLKPEIAKELISDNKAVLYNIDTANRVIKLNGKLMTWGDYLRYRTTCRNNI